MKTNIFLSILLSSILIACTNDNFEEEKVLEKTNNFQTIRSYEEAKDIAHSAIKMLENGSSTRSNGGRRISDLKSHAILASGKTRSGSAQISDTIMYVFNFDNNEGFAVVSANKNTEGLLAITEEGNYDTTDNPGFSFFVSLAEAYLENEENHNEDNSIVSAIPHFRIWELIQEVGPYVTVRWGQTWPLGIYCTNGIVGCTNTATAQIMSFFEHPTNISLAYDSIDINLDWTDIKRHFVGNNPTDCLTNNNNYCTASNTSHYNLARLGKQLVVLNHSNDTNSGSTPTLEYNTLNALNHYGYICTDLDDYSTGDAKGPLDRGHVLFINGFNLYLGGHSFIIDGYEKISTIKKYTTGEPSQVLSEVYYNHINWGWDGDCNGYFLDNIFDTSNANLYDPSTNNNNISIDFDYSVQYSEVYH